MDGGSLYFIRRAKPSDSDACYKICCATGDAGKDASMKYKSDPKALGSNFPRNCAQPISPQSTTFAGRLYTEPYLQFSPVRAIYMLCLSPFTLISCRIRASCSQLQEAWWAIR